MPNTIRIKRRAAGVGNGAPSGLANAELAYNEGDNILYYGFGTGGVGGTATQVIAIAGSGAYLFKSNNLSDLNNLQTSRNNLAGGTVTSGLFMRGNGTNVLMGNILASDVPTLNQNTTGNAGSVTNGVYTGRTLTAGSGLVGGGDLSSDKTFNIGQGDGITVSADAIAVDSTVVRTTGIQSIDGQKTISDVLFNGSVQFVNLSGITGGANYIPVFKEVQGPDTEQSPLVFISNGNFKTDLALNNVTNNAQVKKISSSTIGYVPTWSVNTGDQLGTGYSVETTLTGGTGALPRADAVKTYVDNAIVSGIATNDAMIFKGAIDCSTNPNYPAADRGWTYKVSVAGKIGGASGPVVEVNDTLICATDGTATGTHAVVGSNWTILQTNIVDSSILTTGPASATSGNFVLFDGTTGKILKDSGFAATTVGRNLVSLTNPSAISFLRINADNSVSSLSNTDFRTAIGAGTSSTVGTVTSVAALTLGTTGTDLSSTVANGTTTPTITLNVPTASASNRGVLSNTDWSTFNNKAAANQTMFIGTTSVAINRSSASLVLTGITSIDGNAATVTNGVYTTGSYADPSWITSLNKSKVGLSNVENTALSTWAGSTNITTLGTIGSGTWSATTIAVNKGGTNQTSYVNGELLIGNTTGNTLTKATLTQGSNITITNGNGSITIASTDTNTATAADSILDGSNTGTEITYAPYTTNQAASATPRFYNTNDNPTGTSRLNLSAYLYATNLYDNGSRVVTAATICTDAGNCTWDGGTF